MEPTTVSQHSINIKAPASVVEDALLKLDFSRSRLVAILLWLRGFKKSQRKGIDNFISAGFIPLDTKDGQTLLLGLVGQFWKPSGNIQQLAPAEFHGFNNPDFAKVLWSFSISGTENNFSKLETQTVVYCLSDKVTKRFKRYWFVVGPFSGIIRKEMLKMVKSQAEATFSQEEQ